jgi:uncharacterized membrane protein HdeD (DUF308 family)
MKNATIYYAAIAIGVIALILGILFQVHVFGTHHILGYAGLGVGILLIIVGVVGMVVSKPKAAIK